MPKSRPAPYQSATYRSADVLAIKALAEGKADEYQQTLAFNWILHAASQIDGMSYYPTSDRDTCFAEGKRYVGKQIRKLVNYPQNELAKLMKEEKDGRSHRTDRDPDRDPASEQRASGGASHRTPAGNERSV